MVDAGGCSSRSTLSRGGALPEVTYTTPQQVAWETARYGFSYWGKMFHLWGLKEGFRRMWSPKKRRGWGESLPSRKWLVLKIAADNLCTSRILRITSREKFSQQVRKYSLEMCQLAPSLPSRGLAYLWLQYWFSCWGVGEGGKRSI